MLSFYQYNDTKLQPHTRRRIGKGARLTLGYGGHTIGLFFSGLTKIDYSTMFRGLLLPFRSEFGKYI